MLNIAVYLPQNYNKLGIYKQNKAKCHFRCSCAATSNVGITNLI